MLGACAFPFPFNHDREYTIGQDADNECPDSCPCCGIHSINGDEDKIEKLILISSFNIEARYPDLKRSFRKKCTKEFTTEQMQIVKEIYKWLREMIG